MKRFKTTIFKLYIHKIRCVGTNELVHNYPNPKGIADFCILMYIFCMYARWIINYVPGFCWILSFIVAVLVRMRRQLERDLSL